MVLYGVFMKKKLTSQINQQVHIHQEKKITLEIQEKNYKYKSREPQTPNYYAYLYLQQSINVSFIIYNRIISASSAEL